MNWYLPGSEPNPEECDTTDDDSSTEAGYIILFIPLPFAFTQGSLLG